MMAIWKSRHQLLGISIGIAKNLFCLAKSYMKKTSMVKYFSSTLADLPGSLSRCLEQLFCRKPVSVSFLRKELHIDVISGVLKTRKA